MQVLFNCVIATLSSRRLYYFYFLFNIAKIKNFSFENLMNEKFFSLSIIALFKSDLINQLLILYT